MKKILIAVMVVLSLGWTTAAFSAEAHYKIRADGLACSYCAYGIEKKFMKMAGVRHIDIDLKKGLVLVTGDESLVLKDPQLKTLFNDSGFTFRKIVDHKIVDEEIK